MCECCEEIEYWEEDINKSKEMYVQIVIKNKRNSGTLTTQMFDLNYCPMCGRKLGGN